MRTGCSRRKSQVREMKVYSFDSGWQTAIREMIAGANWDLKAKNWDQLVGEADLLIWQVAALEDSSIQQPGQGSCDIEKLQLIYFGSRLFPAVSSSAAFLNNVGNGRRLRRKRRKRN